VDCLRRSILAWKRHRVIHGSPDASQQRCCDCGAKIRDHGFICKSFGRVCTRPAERTLLLSLTTNLNLMRPLQSVHNAQVHQVHEALRALSIPAGTHASSHAWRKLTAAREATPAAALEAMTRLFPLPPRKAIAALEPPSRLAAWGLHSSHASRIREILLAHLDQSSMCALGGPHGRCAESSICRACGAFLEVIPGAGTLLSSMVDVVMRAVPEEWAQCSETMACVVEDIARDAFGPPSLRTPKDLLWGHVSLRSAPKSVKRRRSKPETVVCI